MRRESCSVVKPNNLILSYLYPKEDKMEAWRGAKGMALEGGELNAGNEVYFFTAYR